VGQVLRNDTPIPGGFSLDPNVGKPYIRIELTTIFPVMEPLMFRTGVLGLYVDQKTGEPVVVLKEERGDRILPIWIGSNEMLPLAVELSGRKAPRPLSHDLIEVVLANLKARIVRAIISDLENHVYKARLILETNAGILEIDSRPSDAIILSLKSGTPVLVEDAVVEERLKLAESEGQDLDAVWQRLQKIDPEDLNIHSL